MSTTEKTSYVNMIAGILLALGVTIVGIYGAKILGYLLMKMNILPDGSSSPISGIFVAILIGIVIRNFIGLQDRKSTRLNSSHVAISYAVILLKRRIKDKNKYQHRVT